MGISGLAKPFTNLLSKILEVLYQDIGFGIIRFGMILLNTPAGGCPAGQGI
jgi:hypothetical protein